MVQKHTVCKQIGSAYMCANVIIVVEWLTIRLLGMGSIGNASGANRECMGIGWWSLGVR